MDSRQSAQKFSSEKAAIQYLHSYMYIHSDYTILHAITKNIQHVLCTYIHRLHKYPPPVLSVCLSLILTSLLLTSSHFPPNVLVKHEGM